MTSKIDQPDKNIAVPTLPPTKITHDDTVLALRDMRLKLDSLASGVTGYRAIIAAQDARIASLHKMHSDAVIQAHDALDRVDQLEAEVTNMGEVIVTATRPGYLRGCCDVYKQRIAQLETAVDDYELRISDLMLERFNQMRNVTRLTNAAVHHLTVAHTLIPPHRFDESHAAIDSAIDLLKPLQGGQHGTYPHQQELEDTTDHRPEDDFKGAPYA